MAAPTGKSSGVGYRDTFIYELDDDGYLAATSTTVYEGIELCGRSFSLTVPDPQTIQHLGCDRVYATDILPPTEAVTGEIISGRTDDALIALITSTKVATIGEAKITGVGTNEQGNEPQVGILAYRQALDETGARVYQGKILPKALINPASPTFDENAQETRYSVLPQFVTKHLWGVAFTQLTEGYTRAQFLDMTTQYKPRIVGFKADGTVVEFLFNTDYPAVSTDKIVVWLDGVIVSTGITPAVTGVTWGSAPPANAMITIMYEFA